MDENTSRKGRDSSINSTDDLNVDEDAMEGQEEEAMLTTPIFPKCSSLKC